MTTHPRTPARPVRARRGWRTATVTLAAAATGLTGAIIAAPAASAPNADVGYPVFSGSATPVPDERTGYDTRNQLQAIFDADVAAGAGSSVDNDFWIDKMLARTGNTPGGSNGDANQWLFSRGKAVFMKTHQPATLGFGGEVAYWETISGGQGAFTITAQINGAPVTLTEVPAERKQTPSYWRSTFTNAAQGIRVVQTKFITGEDVATVKPLSMSVDTSAPVVLAENGSDDEVRQFTGTLPTVTVTDTRAESPAGAYWSVIGNTGDFVDVDDAASTISGTYLGWAPALVEVPVGDDLVSEGEAVESEADGGTGVVGGYDLLVSAFDSEGAREYGSEWKANAALSLRVPVAEAAPGSYESTLTLSLFENE